MNKDLTIPELLEDFNKNEMAISQMDMSNLSENDLAILKTYHEEKAYFTQLSNSLDFTMASALTLDNLENNKFVTSIYTLQEKEEFARQLRTLTNNMDNNFIYTIYAEGYNANNALSTTERLQKFESKSNELICSSFYHNTYAPMEHLNLTTEELSQAIAQTELLMEQHNIDKTNLIESTSDMTFVAYCNKKAYCIEEDLYDVQKEKPAEELVIVESNDGYVMATNASPELFAENPDLERAFTERVNAKNEVVHNEPPKETTIDMAEVGGNVKFEQADDIGSVEKQQGIPDYETKEEMAQRQESVSVKVEESKTETKDKITTHRKTTVEMER